MENLSLAFAARKKFPWATNISERMFFNDVLPYASVDEPRDPWRAEFFAMASDIVTNCRTATEAAQALNRDLFKRINVHYNTGRKRNNQSPKESIAQDTRPESELIGREERRKNSQPVDESWNPRRAPGRPS